MWGIESVYMNDCEKNIFTNDKERKHHYIPVFYLKQWSDCDGRIRYYVYKNGHFVSDTIAPKNTGYERGLYSVYPDDEQIDSNIVEEAYFKKIDTHAANALSILTTDGVGALIEDRVNLDHWVRFLVTLRMRDPISLTKMIDEINSRISTNDPRGVALKNFLFEAENLKTKILNKEANCDVFEFDDSKFDLLTSDSPLGFESPEKWVKLNLIALPIGPRKLFVVGFEHKKVVMLKAVAHTDLVRWFNQKLVEHAHKIVWAHDDKQRRFIQNRLPKPKN